MLTRKNGEVRQPQTWLGAVDVGYLTEAERDAILDVLQRDEEIRLHEQQRIAKLKTELRDVKRKGAKVTDHSYSARVCARCNNKMGFIFNTPTQCPLCKHKVCRDCLVFGTYGQGVKCVVCYQETKLKAETGEWFFGLMRPELRSLQDGTTVVKQAVLTKPVHFDRRNSPAPQQPQITCTPATSSSGTSSKIASSMNSYGTGSSTESRKQISTPRREGPGPAETGSIISLRRENMRRRTVSSEAESPQMNRKSNSLPRSFPPRSPQRSAKMADVATVLLAQHKKQKARELEKSRFHGSNEDVNNPPFLLLPDGSKEFEEDLVSDSSLDSRSIDGAFEEYMQQQQNEQHHSSHDMKMAWHRHTPSNESKMTNDDDYRGYHEEAQDTVDHLPPPQVSTLPRKLNEKLLRQNKLSASVPTVYQSPSKQSANKKMGKTNHHRGSASDMSSDEFQPSMNRDMSFSVPNLSQSHTSLNSLRLHNLTITGEIKFSLGYNYKANVLLVKIVECRNIAMADSKRKRSDPYVKCYLLPDRKNKQKTAIKKRTINPIFNKSLKFSVSHSGLSTRTLELSVWHAGTFTRNLFLGEVLVPLDTWNWDSKNENWFPLRQRDALNSDLVKGTIYKGDLLVALKYVPAGSSSPGRHKAMFGELHLLIKGAKNLAPSRSSGTVDSFVRIAMQPDKQFRQKTSIISKTTSPEWNYNARLQLQQPLQESGLQLGVFHKDKLQGSTLLGGCRINLGLEAGNSKWMDASGPEKALWQLAIDSPFQWVDYSLPLRPAI